MHKNFLTVLMSAALLPSMAFAELEEKQGISGEISFISGYKSQTSNFNTDGDALKSGELNSEGEAENEMFLAPLGNLNYTFGNQQVFIGTSREDIVVGDLALALGYRQEFNSGMVIGVSFLPTLMSGETWADPYLETERTTTDESGNAYRFQLENIAGSRFSLDLAYATTEVDEEQSGSALNDAEEQAQLDRDGSSIYAKGSYKFTLGHGSALIPSLTYVNHSADGKAMSYDSYKGELSYRQKIERHSFAVTTSYTNRSYDGSNPLFNETRSDDEYSLFVAYEYQNVFGWDHWSLVSFAGYSASSSNIEFYDEEEYLMSVGMNYKF